MFNKWCNNCGSFNPKKRCTACKCTLYCDKECQKEHWTRVHKSDCKKMINIVNDKTKGYIVVPFISRERIALTLAFSDHRNAVIPTTLRWEGMDFTVFSVARHNLTGVVSFLKEWSVPLYNDEIIMVKSAAECTSKLQYGLWDDKKHLKWCSVGRELIFTWLLICNRLNIQFPLEIQFEIIPYIVADIRTCPAVRQTMFPLIGPNVFN